jgi:hypothetical protein
MTDHDCRECDHGPHLSFVTAKEFAAEAFVDGLKCWKRTGPTTFCGRHPDHSVHHIKPDSLRFHPFEARPRERSR